MLLDDPVLHSIAKHLLGRDLPTYVKEASLDTGESSGLLSRRAFASPTHRKYPCHTPAACYLSYAQLYSDKHAVSPAEFAEVEKQLQTIADDYGISDDIAKIPDFFVEPEPEDFVAKVAAYSEQLPITELIEFARELEGNSKLAANENVKQWAFSRQPRQFYDDVDAILAEFKQPPAELRIKVAKMSEQEQSRFTPRCLQQSMPQFIASLYTDCGSPDRQEFLEVSKSKIAVYEEPVVALTPRHRFAESSLQPYMKTLSLLNNKPLVHGPLKLATAQWQSDMETAPQRNRDAMLDYLLENRVECDLIS